MSQHYSDPSREDDSYALPDLEVFELTGGWFYWYCFPGCLPDSDAFGPFETQEAALEDAQENASY